MYGRKERPDDCCNQSSPPVDNSEDGCNIWHQLCSNQLLMRLDIQLMQQKNWQQNKQRLQSEVAEPAWLWGTNKKRD